MGHPLPSSANAKATEGITLWYTVMFLRLNILIIFFLYVNMYGTAQAFNACKRNGCHVPLIGDYSIASKCLLACECNIALEWYHTYTMHAGLYV